MSGGDGGSTAEVVLAGLLAAVAGLVYHGVYGTWTFAGPVVGAAVVPAASVAVTSRRGWSTARTAAAASAGLALFVVVAVYPDRTAGLLPGAAAWSALAGGLVDGWALMLTVGLPADPQGDLLVTPVVLTGCAALAAAVTAVATTSPLAPIAPPTAALAAGLALAAASGESHLTATAGFLAVAVALLLLRAGRLATPGVDRADASDVSSPSRPGRDPRQPDATARRRSLVALVAVGAPVVAGVALAGPLIAAALPLASGERFDPRELRRTPLEIGDARNPLGSVKGQLATEEPRDLFRLEVEGLPAGVDRVRVAALDRYDGVSWTSTAEYRLAGTVLAGDPLLESGAAPTTRVHQRITVEGLDGPFLPALGRPVALDAHRAGFDRVSGTLVSPGRDLDGYRYEVTSEVGDLVIVADGDDLAGVRAAADPALDPVRTPPPEVPDELQALALAWASEADTHAAELLALRDRLLEVRYDASADAPPGHSYGALLRMLTGEPGEREGYAEQFAAAFALLARERGFATRVAVGYLLPEPDGNGTYTVTEAEAHAWPEVYLTGRGWVAVEPTDVSRIGMPDDTAEDVPALAAESSDGEATALQPDEPRLVVDESGDRGGPGLPVGRGIALGSLALVGIVAGAPLAVGLAKAVRRRRRRAGDGATQVIGAWDEAVERMAGLGLPVGPAHTATEVASLAAVRFAGAGTAMGALASLATVAVYAPTEPSDAAARRAWACEAAVRAEVRAAVGWRRRAGAWIDPRPLLPRIRR